MEITLIHKEMTAHLRKRLKANDVKANCRLYVSCGSKWIQVYTTAAGIHFTPEESYAILELAKLFGLTFSRGLPIDGSLETLKLSEYQQFDFVFGKNARYAEKLT